MKDTQLAYLAGLLDADGWLSILKNRTRKATFSPSYYPSVGIANTKREMIDWLVEHFGGHVRERQPNEWTIGTKTRYEWRLRTSEIRALLPVVLPHLVIKQPLAILIMELLSTTNLKYRKVGVPKEVLALRESLYQQSRAAHDTKHK